MDNIKYKRVPQNEGESVNQSPRETITKEKRFNKQKDVCLLFVILIAIVYVLARAGASESSCEQYTGNIDEDVARFREEKLASSTPHIIECLEAGEGGSQEKCHLSRDKRFLAVDQKGITLWMTGLSGSGKSTIAKALEQKLVLEYGKHVYRLDGDNIRTGLNRDLGFSPSDRAESVRRVGELSCLFSDSGTITIVSLVSPYRNDRDAVRKRHEEQGIKFFEVFMDVPLEEVQRRDPKGLYEKVKKGELKGFTGVDAPYEAPLHPEISLPNWDMTVDECVNVLLRKLKEEGVLIGAPPVSTLGLPPPDGGRMINQVNLNSPLKHNEKHLRSLPQVLLSDIDLNWAQTIAEGWASPLAGFMRESVLVQSMHFGSVLFDTFNITGNADLYSNPSNLSYDSPVIPRDRVSLSIPIVLPITDFTKHQIEEMLAKETNPKEVALVTKFGEIIGVLRNPEVFVFRKEEVVTRVWGVIDPGHPYIKYLYSAGDWLLGGEIELFDRIRYHDGLDQYRLSSEELLAEFEKKGADVVFAFQTRNPTHAGHAYLMKTARQQLLDMGYRNPVLWLSPLGGWTKPDDVPLDVRVKQHEAVLESGMLDPKTTVMAIWPAPMVYAGPTEVEFHAKSRRSSGASYFVVGRDPAGMKASSEALWNPDDDIYDGDHGKFVLKMSPGMGEMKLLSFSKVYYDKRDHLMRDKDPSRPDDFISISGTKMRALARQGASPCPPTIPSDLLAANCIPPGFMVPSGWNIVVDYYQHASDADRWVPWSQQLIASPELGSAHVHSKGVLGKRTFKAYFSSSSSSSSSKISPWHDIPIKPSKSGSFRSKDKGDDVFNFVVEIPMFSTAKLEVQKEEPYNPIMQDLNKDGSVRYYTYGVPFFNYGLIPQTWEDSDEVDSENRHGDNDPIDVMELGSSPLPIGTVTPIRVLGSLELIDEGEVDYKILAIALSDPLASEVYDLDDLERVKPGTLHKLKHWLKFYKTSDGKPANSLASEEAASKVEAIKVIAHTHASWNDMMTSQTRFEKGFWTGENDHSDDGSDDKTDVTWGDSRQKKQTFPMDDE